MAAGIFRQTEPRRPETDQNLYSKDNHLTGKVESHFANDFIFSEQHHNYKNWKFAQDPTDHSNKVILGEDCNYPSQIEQNDKSVYGLTTKADKEKKAKLKKKRKRFGNPGKGNYLGPWAGYEGEKSKEENELTEE